MPLTGIGHYTQQLGNALLSNKEVDGLELFAHGKFFPKKLLNNDAFDDKNEKAKPNITSIIRAKLASSESIVKVYQAILPYITKVALRNHSDHIFHSPNFVLPTFDGYKITTIHDLSTIRYPQYHPKARVNFVNNAIIDAVDKADHIITDSEFVKNEIIHLLSGSKDKITAIPLGASSSFFPRSHMECKETLVKYDIEYNQYFLFVSTLEPRKNLDNLLDAFTLYREKNQAGLPLVLVGGQGWNNESILDKIKHLEHKGWIKYLGYLPQHHIPILYAAARALLFPSVYEGFGLPVLEAMQSGTPVVTCKDSSMHEITDNCAALVNVDDVDGMADYIERFVLDDKWQCDLSKAGVIRAQAFSWQRCVEETLNVYKALK